MLRLFVHLLMFIVVFLSGMLFGMDREHAQVDRFETSHSENKEEQTKIASNQDDIIIVDQSADMETPVHFTQKTASFLETGVKGFYEVVVEILYQISTFFF